MVSYASVLMRVREASDEPGAFASQHAHCGKRRGGHKNGDGDSDGGEGRERLTGLVERDVPVLADAAEEELDAAVFFDLGFVGFAFADEVFGVAVEDVYL